jgi:peptide/nickel transport system substrate-binding protein
VRIKINIKTIFIMFFMILSIAFPASGKDVSGFSRKDTLVVCLSTRIVSLDPTNHRDRDTQMVIKNIFDSLTTRDRHLKVIPQLAASWQAKDPTTWEFELKKGIRFHNGDELTAADVKFTLDRVTKQGGMDGRTSPRQTLLARISDVIIMGPHTVRIMTDRPWPILPMMLSLQEIVPKSTLQQMGSREFAASPVGTGPFKFVKQTKDGTLVLERFDAYNGNASPPLPEQKSAVKYLIFKTVPDPVRRLALLKKGEADIIADVSIESVSLLNILPGIRVVSQPATRSYFADLNCKKPPFNKLEARLAVNYAVDMQRIVNSIFQGRARVLPTILLHQSPAYNTDLLPYPYAPREARRLLSNVAIPKHYVVKIVCLNKFGEFANAISSYLARAGIQSSITIGEKDDVRAAMKNQEADILVTSWGNTTLDPVGILWPKLKTNGRGNFSNYSNKEVDQLLLSAEKTMDTQLRNQYYKEIQTILYRDAPMLFGYAGEEYYGVSERVKGFYPSPTGMLNFHDISLE